MRFEPESKPLKPGRYRVWDWQRKVFVPNNSGGHRSWPTLPKAKIAAQEFNMQDPHSWKTR